MEHDDDKTQTHVPLTAATMVSHYRIIDKIGAGGMAEVYLAEDTALNRKVALKILLPHLCQDPDCRVRFKRVVEAVARLDHLYIVSILDVGEFEERPFLTMPHVEGKSLREVCADNLLSPDRALEIGIQVCEGLQAAHEGGVIHGDVKPSNILLDRTGKVKLLDFGLTVIKGSEHLTRSGTTLGTLAYMSPERVLDEEIDGRSDIWSVGVVLCELMTGRLPFTGDHKAAVVHAIVCEDPVLLNKRTSPIVEDVRQVIARSLQKDRGHRYATAQDLLWSLKYVREKLNMVVR